MKTEGEGNMISDWLEKHGDPEIDAFVAKNLSITEQIHKTLEAKGWTQTDLAKAMGKRNSEVSKWLSGMHNLTLKSIVKMEMALNKTLIYTASDKEYETIYFGKIENTKEVAEKVEDYKPGELSAIYEMAV